jgi:hypothetical protein
MFRTALISLFLTSTALADTWTVDDDGKADFDNIQAAVDAASDGDTTNVVTALPKDRVVFVVEPFLGKATSTSMHIAWETSTNASTAVEYGTSKSLGLSEDGYSITGSGAGYIHHVDLMKLSPDTRYYYKCISDTTETPIYSFRTPPIRATGKPFTFVAYSDCQTGNEYYKHEEVVNEGIVDFYSKEYGGNIEDHLAFSLIPGDLVTTGSSHNQWVNEFFGQSKNLYRHVPLYPALGNHEANANLYYMYFDLFDNAPAGLNEHCYWFDYQNIRIITLDSNGPFDSQSQLNWLDDVLADACANTEIDFLLVQFHHPHKSESWTPGESSFSTAAVERVEQFSTDCGKPSIHFFGHTHSYSRGQSRDHDHLMVSVASGSGSLDYWWAYPNEDYEEFQTTLQEWGFVQMEVGSGTDPWLRLKRISRGNDYVPLDNVVTDEFVIRTNNQKPVKPVGQYPTIGDGEVSGDNLSLVGSGYADPDGDAALESHWQVATTAMDFDDPLQDHWKRRENWYRPDNGDGWYSINTVTDPDITRTVLNDSVPGCTTLFWRVRYRDEVLGWSDWSNPISFEVGESSHGDNSPIPPDGSEDVPIDITLSWNPCDPANLYDVYFGISENLSSEDFQGSQIETSWSPPELDHLTTWYWRIDRHVDDTVEIGETLSFTTRRAYTISEWRFDDSTPSEGSPLQASHGTTDLIPTSMEIGSDWGVFATDGFGIPHIGNTPTRYIWMDNVFGANRGLAMEYQGIPNGGGGSVEVFEYTYILDLFIDGNQDQLQALLQGNDTNSNDAEWYLDCTNGGFWLYGTGYIGADMWPQAQWFRAVLRVDNPDSAALFINGVKVLDDDQLSAPDSLWGATSGLKSWLLSDNGPDYDVGFVRCANAALVDGLMTDTEITELAGPNAEGIFVDQECIGDINGDGYVNINDLLILIGSWGSANPAADFNFDGIVDIEDLLIFIAAFGPCE